MTPYEKQIQVHYLPNTADSQEMHDTMKEKEFIIFWHTTATE
jgi:hypothetical protein